KHPEQRLGLCLSPGLPPSLRRPQQPRPAGAVMPRQAIAVDPRPPEPQPGRHQRHRAHRIADPERAPRRPCTVRPGQVQPPGTHADGLAAAAPADRGVAAGEQPAHPPQRELQRAEGGDVLVRIVAGEGVAEREHGTGDHPHRQHRPQVVEQREQAPADQGGGAGRGRGGRFHRLGCVGGGRSLVQRTARPATSPARIARLARMDTRDPARPRARTPADRRQAAMALPPLPDADATVIDAFLDATWAEAGLARPTLDSYRRDLGGFARWRGGRAGGLAGADRAALFDYLAWRMRENYSPRSNARLLSALRAFYGWRVRRGERTDDPTALLEPPRLPRLLPKALDRKSTR